MIGTLRVDGQFKNHLQIFEWTIQKRKIKNISQNLSPLAVRIGTLRVDGQCKNPLQIFEWTIQKRKNQQHLVILQVVYRWQIKR